MFRKFFIVAAAALALTAGTATAQPTAQGLRADGLRWQGLADHYGRLQGLKADGLRWQAMARFYKAQAAAPVASPSRGFDWADAGIGAVAGFVVLLGAGGALVFVRRGRRTKLAL